MAEENINELFKRYRETGDTAVRNKIAEKYLYIAEILAKKFVGRGVEYDDLRQAASTPNSTAASLPSRGYRLAADGLHLRC